MGDRQLDILGTHPDWFTIPRYMPGRLNSLDFVFFSWCDQIDPNRYTVAILTDSPGSPDVRGISKLSKNVLLPLTQLGAHPRIGVIPDSSDLPLFEGELHRGSTYNIPKVNSPGRYQLEQHGMIGANGL